VLVHPGEFILPELGGKLGRYADKKVRARGVEIFSKSKVAAVRPREIELTNAEKIISSTLVWTAGTSPNPILDFVACAKERGRIKVNPHLEVEGPRRPLGAGRLRAGPRSRHWRLLSADCAARVTRR